jgi:nuclear transport factor 2 (NTF2) superfamily protein
VALAYAIDSRWRNRSEFITGRTTTSPLWRQIANITGHSGDVLMITRD